MAGSNRNTSNSRQQDSNWNRNNSRRSNTNDDFFGGRSGAGSGRRSRRCATASVRNEQEYSQCDYKENNIYILTPCGEQCIGFEYNDPNRTILWVKDVVEEYLGQKAPPNKQCLMYNNIELKEKNEKGEFLTLKDHNVQPNSRIHLLVLLYAIPDELDDVIFDLFWGYPNSGKDYLDASVLLYSGSNFVELVDGTNNVNADKSCPGAVRHSGDVMDNKKRLGHHTINVSIKSLPAAHINRLVFTLSAWKSPNISKYPNPSLRFFDAKKPDEQLCEDKMSNAAYFQTQAIIMCCLSNTGGKWQVFSLGRPSAGNARNYGPLKDNIASLIEEGSI